MANIESFSEGVFRCFAVGVCWGAAQWHRRASKNKKQTVFDMCPRSIVLASAIESILNAIVFADDAVLKERRCDEIVWHIMKCFHETAHHSSTLF